MLKRANCHKTGKPNGFSTRFQAGQPAANPGGRPKGIASLARRLTDAALTALEDALRCKQHNVRVMAAKEILDRGYGKSIQMTADLTNRLDDFDDEQLDAAIAILRSSVGPAAQDAGGEASPVLN